MFVYRLGPQPAPRPQTPTHQVIQKKPGIKQKQEEFELEGPDDEESNEECDEDCGEQDEELEEEEAGEEDEEERTSFDDDNDGGPMLKRPAACMQIDPKSGGTKKTKPDLDEILTGESPLPPTPISPSMLPIDPPGDGWFDRSPLASSARSILGGMAV